MFGMLLLLLCLGVMGGDFSKSLRNMFISPVSCGFVNGKVKQAIIVWSFVVDAHFSDNIRE